MKASANVALSFRARCKSQGFLLFCGEGLEAGKPFNRHSDLRSQEDGLFSPRTPRSFFPANFAACMKILSWRCVGASIMKKIMKSNL